MKITRFETKILDKQGDRLKGLDGLAMLLVDEQECMTTIKGKTKKRGLNLGVSFGVRKWTNDGTGSP